MGKRPLGFAARLGTLALAVCADLLGAFIAFLALLFPYLAPFFAMMAGDAATSSWVSGWGGAAFGWIAGKFAALAIGAAHLFAPLFFLEIYQAVGAMLSFMLNLLITVFMLLSFFVIYKSHGAQLLTPRTIKRMLGGILVKITPFAFVPWWTFCAVSITAAHNRECREEKKKQLWSQQGERVARGISLRPSPLTVAQAVQMLRRDNRGRLIRNAISTLVLICACGGASSLAYAQIPSLLGTDRELQEQGISIQFEPRHPRPNETVTVTLDSLQHELGNAQIAWVLDGVPQKGGTGERTFTFKTKQNGAANTLGIYIETLGGMRITRELTVRPALVNVHWEAQTYTPPFYRGKALLTPQSSVRLIAVPEFIRPDGSMIPENELIYTWREGTRTLIEQSGLGRSSITLPTNLFTTEVSVSVVVESRDGALQARGLVYIPMSAPSLQVYEFHPTLGIRYAHAIRGKYTLPSDEIVFVAEPFFFPVQSRTNNDITLEWSLNRRLVGSSPLTTFRRDPENSREVAMGVSAKHRTLLLQFAEMAAAIR